MPSPDLHKPTAECPIFTPRQKRMLDALRRNGIPGLTLAIHDLAGEDVAEANTLKQNKTKTYDQRIRIGTASQYIINDANSNENDLDQLLLAVHVDVLEALILGTMVWKHQSEPDFEKKLLKSDGCAGIYLLSFRIGGTRRGLTRIQWKELQNIMKRYLNSDGVVVTSSSSMQDKENAELAAKIDSKIARRFDDFTDVLEDCKGGLRAMANSDLMEFFAESLSLRIDTDNLDPSGNTRQLQFPCNIGCANHLKVTLGQHNDQTDMSELSSTLRFLLSCLRAMGVDARLMEFPLVKIWKETQYRLAEAAFTLLAGSMIQHGGTNQKEAGTNPLNKSANDRFESALEDYALNAPWIHENLADTRKRVNHQKEVLNYDKKIGNIAQSHYDAQAMLQRKQAKVMELLDKKEVEVRSATKKLEERIEYLKAENERLENLIPTLSAEKELSDKLRAWRKGEIRGISKAELDEYNRKKEEEEGILKDSSSESSTDESVGDGIENISERNNSR